VTDGVKGLCSGGDPLATITSMASTCASAIAEMQASSISGAEVNVEAKYPVKNFTKSAYTTACTSGCSNGQVTAEAVAQASACAFSTQTRGCNAVKTALSGQSYSTAFIQTTAKSWSNACALGFGKAHGEGEALAKGLVTVLSRAFGDVVAKACSECDTCKCSPLPLDLAYDNMRGASDTAGAAANGRYTMSKAFSSATAKYCTSDKTPKALRTAVDTTVSTLATMIADVYAKTTGSSSATGSALACSGGSVTTKIQVGFFGSGWVSDGCGGWGGWRLRTSLSTEAMPALHPAPCASTPLTHPPQPRPSPPPGLQKRHHHGRRGRQQRCLCSEVRLCILQARRDGQHAQGLA